MFETLEAAADALLLTTCNSLRNNEVEFIIVGGWSPFLRKGAKNLHHPGTRDVDVLFKDEDLTGMRRAMKNMLSAGFKASAKHEFQMLISISVDTREFIFNVDFMHPSEQCKNPELLSDIFDLGVPDSSDPTGRRWIKSIVFQPAKLVFQHELFSTFEHCGLDVYGESLSEKIPLLSEAGLVLSKLNSVKLVKRPRDAFDIYYVLAGPNGSAAADTIKMLANEIDEVQEQVRAFLCWLDGKAHVFDNNVYRYAQTTDKQPSVFVNSLLRT